MRKLTRSSLLVLGLVAAVTVIPSSSASADSSQCSLPSGTCAGKVTFQSYGEHLLINDRAGDGHSAVVLYWRSDGSGPYYGWNASGTGTQVDVNLELAEGEWIFYKACVGEYGTRTLISGSCSAGATDFA